MSDEHKITLPDGQEMVARWSDRTEQIFHDVAETLGTTTDLIMAANKRGRTIVALYTPGYPEDRTIWSATLRVNRDGTLRLSGRERSKLSWDQITADLDAKMRAKFGEPKDAPE